MGFRCFINNYIRNIESYCLTMKNKLLNLNRKDFEIQTFRSGGKGGQHQNTTDSGVRIVHKESGAIGESRNYRS